MNHHLLPQTDMISQDQFPQLIGPWVATHVNSPLQLYLFVLYKLFSRGCRRIGSISNWFANTHALASLCVAQREWGYSPWTGVWCLELVWPVASFSLFSEFSRLPFQFLVRSTLCCQSWVVAWLRFRWRYFLEKVIFPIRNLGRRVSKCKNPCCMHNLHITPSVSYRDVPIAGEFQAGK